MDNNTKGMNVKMIMEKAKRFASMAIGLSFIDCLIRQLYV